MWVLVRVRKGAHAFVPKKKYYEFSGALRVSRGNSQELLLTRLHVCICGSVIQKTFLITRYHVIHVSAMYGKIGQTVG